MTLNADGAFTYTPSVNFSDADSFTYKANDGAADSNIATVTITITAAPRRDPVANADSYSTLQGTTLTVGAPGVLGNDNIGTGGGPLRAVLVSNPSNGTLTLNADGSFTYRADANFRGVDSFTYKANDGTIDSNIVTVTITIMIPEPSLTEILTGLGFTNIVERPGRQAFPAGTYELQLLAEFSANHEGNIVSQYPVSTSGFQVLINGSEGNFGFTNPPISKQFTASARFGLALDTPAGERFFTQDRRNSDGVRHVRIFRDRNDPGSFLIGLKTYLIPVIWIFRM